MINSFSSSAINSSPPVRSAIVLLELSPRKISASKSSPAAAYFLSHELSAAFRSCKALKRSGSASRDDRYEFKVEFASPSKKNASDKLLKTLSISGSFARTESSAFRASPSEVRVPFSSSSTAPIAVAMATRNSSTELSLEISISIEANSPLFGFNLLNAFVNSVNSAISASRLLAALFSVAIRLLRLWYVLNSS